MDADGIHVLLIEDNAEYAASVADYLTEHSPGEFRLTHVERLAAGIARLFRGGIDVILLDLELPDSHGLDTYVTVRSQAPQVPAVVLTGTDDEAMAVAAAREGAQDYLVKGTVRGDSLVRCLHYAIERHHGLARLKRYARELSTSESRFRRIVDEYADALVVVGDDEVWFANRAAGRLYGVEPEALVGQPFEPAPIPGRTSEVEIDRGDGDRAVAEMVVVETRWDGEPALVAALRDVTERKRARDLRARVHAQALLVEQLMELDRGKARFVRDLTAEVQEPLTPLRDTVDAFLDGSLGDLTWRQREVLELVGRRLEGLARFADGVHTLSRLDAGTYPVRVRPFDLGACLEAAVHDLRPALAEQQVHITLEQPDSVEVLADPDEVVRALAQLLADAVTRNPVGAAVRIAVGMVDPERVGVEVSDDGQVHGQDARERALERYAHLEEGALGAGVGLALCKALIERMGGTISARSRVGEGATVSFTLPARNLGAG